MLLTWPMFTLGLFAALGQVAAHYAMKDRTYHTPIPRYAVGVAIALAAYSIAYAIDPRQDAIIGPWFVFGCCGVATFLAYEADRPAVTEADIEHFISHIEAEHTDESGASHTT